METLDHLTPETLERLRDLIRHGQDSARVLEEAAASLEADTLRELFEDLAVKRRTMSGELARRVAENEQRPPTRGTLTGRLRRAWLSLKTSLGAADPRTVLATVAAVDEVTRGAYERAFLGPAGTDVLDVFRRHYVELECDRSLLIQRRHELESAEEASG